MNARNIMTTTMRVATALAAALGLGACGELAQDGAKPFVEKDETQSYETALADRVRTQDEYAAYAGSEAAAQARTRTASSRSQ